MTDNMDRLVPDGRQNAVLAFKSRESHCSIRGMKAPANARLLLFLPDPGKRHYFYKYVLGIIWHRLTDDEQQERLRQVVMEKNAAAVAATFDGG